MNATIAASHMNTARPWWRRISLTQWMLIAVVFGVWFGWQFPEQAKQLEVVSNIFLRLIKCIIVPLLFSTLIVGIAGHTDDLKAVGRLALKSIIYFEIVTTIALAIGLITVNLAKPGLGVSLKANVEKIDTSKQQATASAILEHAFPQSFFDSAAANDVLQVVVFAILFAVALTRVNAKSKQTMLGFFEAVSEVMFKFTDLVMKFAPFGVAAAMAITVSKSGITVLQPLLKLIATLYEALIALIVLVFVPVALMARIPILKFCRTVKDPALIAFSTTTSDAALPLALERMIEFGVPRRIVSFVLPAGYSFNLDGSTLYLAVASIFVAQAAGVDMSLRQQLAMMLTLMLTSKGVAAVPRASLIILMGTLMTFHLPVEGAFVIMGVDTLMDMARTGINLIGNCLASAVMARWEGEFKETKVTPSS